MAEQQWVPTVNDLRVKLCYICREEEHYDSPEVPPRAWTHPCSCTLVAHERCLLQWIKSAQQDPARVGNALKCPQCGTTYELESDNPRILRVLNAINSAFSAAGKVATVMGVVGLATSFGFTLYVVSTSYGAFAVKEFLGEDMYNLLLTDDPSNWPWHAFIHLPMIPFSLILSRTRLFDNFPLVPLFLTWSSSPPVRTPSSSSLFSPWSRSRGSQIHYTPALNWPPTPLMGIILFPFVRTAYRRLFDKLTRYVMGVHSDDSSERGGAGAPIRRVIWALNEDGPAPLRVRIGANIEQVGGAQGAQGQGGQGAQQPRNANGNVNANGDGEGGNDAPDDPAEVAERTLHVTTSSLGRFIGGALLVPTISSRMGALLFRLSKHSAFLRAFLAIREKSATASLPTHIQIFNNGPPGSQVGLLRQVGSGLVAGLNIMCGGTPTWNSQDPVWWRNAVGLGLFVFVKDCVRLLHLYLTKRELESRTVKNRSFAGVDIRELDLIRQPSPLEVAVPTQSVPLDTTSTETLVENPTR